MITRATAATLVESIPPLTCTDETVGGDALSHGCLQQGAKPGDVFGRRREPRERLPFGRAPVAPEAHVTAGEARHMRGRDAADGAKRRRAEIAAPNDQEVGDRALVELVRHRGMEQQRVERAGHQQLVARARVVERNHAELIASAQQTSAGRVPEREREVAGQHLDERVAPRAVCLEQQLGVAGAGVDGPAVSEQA